ncbi:S8 family serine peptidase [Chryseolinea sp. H1M3-3]|uniref:S8 family serine peptidase n=1 Tax=Chryseolinea sp. H1M3-3 TaxID=3034144 RepID=UPI0023EC3C2E|nr:S8 family serine peptidase [Chryseolinea sp. H1M3-3]
MPVVVNRTRVIAVLALLLCILHAYAQTIPAGLPDQIPDRIIIHYESRGKAASKGREIISEHRKLTGLVSDKLKVPIKDHSPAFPGIVDQMIRLNSTETDLPKDLSKRLRNKRPSPVKSSLSKSIVVKLNRNENIQFLIDQINNDKTFLQASGFVNIRAERINLFYVNATPNDPMFSSQWSHAKTGATEAWDVETGDVETVIGIIDTGIDAYHEDLRANIHDTGYDFVDIDTALFKSYGYQFLEGEDYTVPDNNPADYNGHGTHVAGIAAGVGDNNVGISGVCHNCSILPVRAGCSILYFGAEYGILPDDAIANAIVYATDNGADIINMSFGGRGSFTIKSAIDYAYAQGVILVAAAGNYSTSDKYYPGGYDEVVAVASSDRYDNLSYFSNYGSWVDIVAPGHDILSTVPSVGSQAGTNGYKELSGTSMASPYIAGVAGLLKSKNPSLTREEIISTLYNTADNIDALNPSYVSLLGYGRVNVSKAIANMVGPNIVFNGTDITEIIGNKDGNINAGEQISLVVNLQNTWRTADMVSATLSSDDSNVSISQTVGYYQSIPGGSIKGNTDTPFIFTISSSIPPNHKIAFSLEINYDEEIKNVAFELETVGPKKFEVPGIYQTIQAAINAASDGDIITVSPGVYYENIDFIGKDISVVSLYHSTGDSSYIEKTIIDGSKPVNATKGTVVTFVSGETASALLSGFTIRKGSGTSNTYSGGGGILSVGSSPVLQNLVIKENTVAAGSGAGIFVSGGMPTLKNLILKDNRNSAGIYVANVTRPDEIMMRNVRVIRSIDNDGIYVSSSNVKLRNIIIEDCTGTIATGLFAIRSTIELDSAVITGNRQGVDARANEKLIIKNTAIIDNFPGGAITSNSTTLELVNATIAGNKLTNHYGGAGIFLTNEENHLTIINSILYNNLWTKYNTGIIRADAISFLDDGGALTVAYSNVQGGKNGLHFFDGSSKVIVNWLAGNLDADPIFYHPEKKDYHLGSGSPCTATGIAYFETNEKIYVDLKPEEFEGAAPDMGAYLFNHPYLKAAFTTDRTTGNIPLKVQFTDESYGFYTTPPDTWTWDFGDGNLSTNKNPVHEYKTAGDYTVKLTIRNNVYEDHEIKVSLLHVVDSDTLYVATTGSNTTGTGARNKPFKTIQHGIDRADDDDVILVADGLYKENINFNGKDVRVSSHYQLDNNTKHVASTIIDGSSNGRAVVFSNNEGPNAGLSGLTVQNGFANGNNYPAYYGGGIFIENSNPTIVDVLVKNNKSNYRGGGIFIENGDPRLERVTVQSNESVFNYSEGGGIYISQSKSVIKDTKIVSNRSGNNGGGLFLGYLAAPDIQNLTIQNNTAVNGGGGLHIESNNLELSAMYILNNTAANGGGVYSSFSNNTIRYSVVSKNSATHGGGIYYTGNSANPKLDHVTLYNNAATTGREVYTQFTSKVYISNAILWNNTDNVIFGNAFISYSDVKGGRAGTGNINANPKLKDPVNDDYSLTYSSPCIDAGDPSSSPDANATRADMGAYYYGLPIIEGVLEAITMPEDTEREISISNFKVKNVGNDFPATYSLKLHAGQNYTVLEQTIRPSPNFNGPLMIPVTLSKGNTTSEVYDLLVTVTAVNDAPVILDHESITTMEDVSITMKISDLKIADVDGDNFFLKILPGFNYAVEGTLVTPLENFYGMLSVPVVANDGTNDSEPFNVNITVSPINDAPVIAGQNTLKVDEDNQRMIEITDIVFSDVDDIKEDINLQLTAGANYSLSGFTVTPDENYNGPLFVPVVLSDGSSESSPYLLEVMVNPVNDAPKILGGESLTLEGNGQLELSLDHVEAIDIDNDLDDLLLLVLPGPDYTVQNNTLQPLENFSGPLKVNVLVNDGEMDSEVFLLDIEVLPFTSIEAQLSNTIQVYPNPAQQYVQIESGGNQISNIQLFSNESRRLNISQSFDIDTTIIDTSHLPAGPYLLCIQTDEGVVWKRIMIVR